MDQLVNTLSQPFVRPALRSERWLWQVVKLERHLYHGINALEELLCTSD